MSGAICTVEGCESQVRCVGLCNKHYHVLKNSRKMKPCGCGCGGLTSHTYLWGHHTRLFSAEEQSRRGRMNDGSALRDRGAGKSYRKVGGRHEHRIVAEQKLGRALRPSEVVHHRNETIRDNRPDNLEVMTRAAHMDAHRPAILAGKRNAKSV